MESKRRVLYIHGMGGGEDSRIPALLKSIFSDSGPEIIIQTYDFDPLKASAQIAGWIDCYRPDRIVCESLGACHGARLGGIPRIFVSPALNAARNLAFASRIINLPGMKALACRLFPQREGKRQRLVFEKEILEKYACIADRSSIVRSGFVKAYFGTRDHYRWSGTVSVRKWEKTYGKGTYVFYEGSHFMENEYVRTMLAPDIMSILDKGDENLL